MSFCQFLETRAKAANSLLCIGLDPRTSTAAQAENECISLIDKTHTYTAAFKPNIAFFEVFGAEGIAALKRIIQHIPADIPVILDAKRGDIPDTSSSYATAMFDELGAHAVTASPYIGSDGLRPFFENPSHGVFVLCKTSNKGADEFQALRVREVDGAAQDEIKLFEYVAQRAQAWNTNDNVGLVVGATDSLALSQTRTVAPHLWFLVPGIGAQGGHLQSAISNGLRSDGMGLLFNVSRSVARAADPAAEARRVRDEINQCREQRVNTTMPSKTDVQIEQLAADLLTSGCVKFGRFTMKSGIVSPIYLDLRRLVTYPSIMHSAAKMYAHKLGSLQFDRIAGIPYAALPIATAISLEMNRPLIYPRREAKDYGTKASIEGIYREGETAVVIDDLITTGGSKFEAIEKLTEAGLLVRDVVVLIDRSFDGTKVMADAGYRLHSVVTIHDLLPIWERTNAITAQQANDVRAFLKK